MNSQTTTTTFHLFAAPGEAGYVKGAMTSAGRFAPSETGDADWDAACDKAAGEVIERLGLTWLANGELLGPCGLVLPEDYIEQIGDAAERASEAFCVPPAPGNYNRAETSR